VASLGIIASWGFIVVCQMRLRKAIKEGKAADVSFKMPGAPFTSWLTLLFLFSVLVLMAFDYPNGLIPSVHSADCGLLVAGWFGVRKRVHDIHSARILKNSNKSRCGLPHRANRNLKLNYLPPAATHRCC
jgi:L-asparagine permease